MAAQPFLVLHIISDQALILSGVIFSSFSPISLRFQLLFPFHILFFFSFLFLFFFSFLHSNSSVLDSRETFDHQQFLVPLGFSSIYQHNCCC
ncbi:hypothetical protein LOK49_LG04G03409 [Camellia lanceoleosa]|uniref:Uncharacterized protein n=1 Tax=Camellia lanceoleosa TaxID=1840588 RepID=A0ACC0I0Z2_9ERIC|nr:hypothetical protein LOK49_LG04G03409 [Camellia lanceoleosa]